MTQPELFQVTATFGNFTSAEDAQDFKVKLAHWVAHSCNFLETSIKGSFSK
jgi:hypothetical protein